MTRKRRMKAPEKGDKLSSEIRAARARKGASSKVEVSIPELDRWESRAKMLEAEVDRLFAIIKIQKDKEKAER